jgi:hypothetical protein
MDTYVSDKVKQVSITSIYLKAKVYSAGIEKDSIGKHWYPNHIRVLICVLSSD